jgi:polyphenol oxidase
MTTHARPLTDRAGPARIRTAGALRLLTWPALDASGADAAVTARDGGVSRGPYATLNLSLSVGDDPAAVRENRRRLAAGLGVDPGAFVFARQVHGARVRVVGEADRGSGALRLDDAIADADALVSTSPGVVLAILTADCVPIVLHDPAVRVLACVHAGWRGTAAGVTAAAVAAMQSLGSRPSDILVGLGPAIAPARYLVGPDVHQAVTRAFGPPSSAFLRPDAVPGRWLLDLWAANRHALRQSGIPDPQIHITNLPTGPIDPATPVRNASPAHPVRNASPAHPVRNASPAHPVRNASLTDPASPGYFFSDRAVRPCGRLALVARLRVPGQNPWL